MRMARPDREPVGWGQHRHGWPLAVEALRDACGSDGILLDDFVERSFCYDPLEGPYREPWAGIFHHPGPSRWPGWARSQESWAWIALRSLWIDSLRHLRAAVFLCAEQAADIQQYLPEHCRVLIIHHPRPEIVPPPSPPRRRRRVVQVGWYLRDTRAIHRYRVETWNGWSRSRLVWPDGHWAGEQDRRVRRDNAMRGVKEWRPEEVDDTPFLHPEDYDALLDCAVILSHPVAAAANNVLVDCAVRGAPLLTPRSSAAVDYLGRGYPLFYDDAGPLSLDELLVDDRIAEASESIQQAAQRLPTYAEFADTVRDFLEGVR